MIPENTETLAVDLLDKTVEDLTANLELKFYGTPDKSKQIYHLFDGSEIEVINNGKTLSVEITNRSSKRNFNVFWPETTLNKKIEIELMLQ